MQPNAPRLSPGFGPALVQAPRHHMVLHGCAERDVPYLMTLPPPTTTQAHAGRCAALPCRCASSAHCCCIAARRKHHITTPVKCVPDQWFACKLRLGKRLWRSISQTLRRHLSAEVSFVCESCVIACITVCGAACWCCVVGLLKHHVVQKLQSRKQSAAGKHPVNMFATCL